MKVSVIPFYPEHLNNKFFNSNSKANRDNALEPFIEIKRKLDLEGFDVNTVDITPIKNADFIVMFDLDIRLIIQAFFFNKLHKCIYISFEPPVVSALHTNDSLLKISKLFAKVLTWQDDLVDEQKIIKFYFPIPSQSRVIDYPAFEDKKLLTTVVGYKYSTYPNELYSKRIEAIRYFEENVPGSFDLFGMGWNKSDFPSYKGPVDDKLNTMSQYKFTLCYENQCDINGLISEKIFDCFHARSIPIFWGADNIDQYIPALCFIDKRQFSSYQDLHKYLQNITNTEYQMRIDAIEKYLQSDTFKRHSAHNFVKTIKQTLTGLDSTRHSRAKAIKYLFMLFSKKIQYKLRKKLG